MATKYKTGPAVASFADVFEPNEYNGKRKFSITLIYKGGEDGPHGAELKKLKAVAQACVKEAFPDGKVPKGFNSPFKDGGECEYEGYGEGDVYVKFWRHEKSGRPPVVGPDRRPLTAADFYSGCEAIVAYRPYVYDNKEFKSRGLNFGLEAVQKYRTGERLGGAAPVDPEEVFDELEVEVEGDEVAF